MNKLALPTIASCDNCGACCHNQAALPVHLVGTHFRERSVSPLPEWLRAELRETIERFQAEGWPPEGSPCIWFDAEKKACRHYEHRPQICRDALKPGDETCRRIRRAEGVDPTPRYRLVRGRLVKEMAKRTVV